MAIEIVEWKDDESYWPWLLAFPESVAAGQGLPSTPETLWDAFRCGETEASDEDGEVWAWGQHWGTAGTSCRRTRPTPSDSGRGLEPGRCQARVLGFSP